MLVRLDDIGPTGIGELEGCVPVVGEDELLIWLDDELPRRGGDSHDYILWM